MEAPSKRYNRARMDELKALFRRRTGRAPAGCEPLKGDGSARRLYRLTAPGVSLIGAANDDRLENEAFLAFSRHFRKRGLPVPEIYENDLKKGVYLEEDLGDTTLFQHLVKNRSRRGLSSDTIAYYKKAIELLPRFQIESGRSLDYSRCYPRPSFDRQSMMWDMNYFKYYFLRLAKIPFGEQALEDDFKRFADYLLEAPRDFFLYRDFQSRNIMIRGGEPWFIDYQGGRKGALQYDVASLLYDAKADLPFDLRDELLKIYLAKAAKMTRLDKRAFLSHFPAFVYIRIMQAMGAYGLRGFYERKAQFLQSIPYAVRNLEHLLRTTELPVKLPTLMEVFRRIVASSALRQFGNVSLELTLRVQSFSFKDGIPADEKGHGGGFVFDCRSLPNPGRYERYSELTGRDGEVARFLKKERPVNRFMKNVIALVDSAVSNYRTRNFTDLMVAFGCTGGRHRSVYCAELLAKHVRKKHGIKVEVRHRGQERPGA